MDIERLNVEYRCQVANRKTVHHAQKFTEALLLILGCEEVGIQRLPNSNNKENQTQKHLYTNVKPQN